MKLVCCLTFVTLHLLLLLLLLSELPRDPCDTNDCDPNAYCTPTGESFTCQCAPGYSGDGRTCYQGKITDIYWVSPQKRQNREFSVMSHVLVSSNETSPSEKDDTMIIKFSWVLLILWLFLESSGNDSTQSSKICDQEL